MDKIELVGEIGTNHNGDINEAFKIINLASNANIDTVKFQIYTSKDIVSPLVPTSLYGVTSQYKYWKDYIDNQLITPINWLERIIPYCKQLGIDIITTVHSISAAEQCLKLGIKRLKIASMDCNYTSFLKEISKLEVPVLLSTGMADKYEIMKAVDIFLNNNIDLTLFHCTATYPTKYEEANLDFINFLKILKPSKLGLSDHSENNDLVLMSIPYGVRIIEKHITIDRSQVGPDHSFALDLDGMIDWRKKTDNAMLALGTGEKVLSINELRNRTKFRRKPILLKEKKSGELLSEGDLYFARAEDVYFDSIDLDQLSFFIGMKFTSNVNKDKSLRKGFFI